MITKFAIGFNIITVPDDWLRTTKWKVYFYYRQWPWAHNDNEPTNWWTK